MPTPSGTPTDPFDVIGIGVGPFNLGLAALLQPLVDDGEISALFLDERDHFSWHPGMMLPAATIQVPFLADLVTLADPTSSYSFLAYLKARHRIHQFYIRESFYPLRSEYSDYCAWVADQLSTVEFSRRVTDVRRTAEGLWRIDVQGSDAVLHARHVVMGVGTRPFIPEDLSHPDAAEGILHSADYLTHCDAIEAAETVAVIGSGQSAAEIYRDLLDAPGERRLDWFTRSPRFFPMEYTKLSLELTSPDYTRHFHSLPMGTRDELNRRQRGLYKGISGDLVDDIYDTLYRLSTRRPVNTRLLADVHASFTDEATTDGTTGRHHVALEHAQTGERSVTSADMVILATGYRAPAIPDFLATGKEALRLDPLGRLDVGLEFDCDDDGTFFVLNAEEHTHALNAPDLGMGAWRNSIIIRRILGREVYPVEDQITFQSFGLEGAGAC